MITKTVTGLIGNCNPPPFLSVCLFTPSRCHYPHFFSGQRTNCSVIISYCLDRNDVEITPPRPLPSLSICLTPSHPPSRSGRERTEGQKKRQHQCKASHTLTPLMHADVRDDSYLFRRRLLRAERSGPEQGWWEGGRRTTVSGGTSTTHSPQPSGPQTRTKTPPCLC